MIIRLCLLQCLCAIFYFFHLAATTADALRNKTNIERIKWEFSLQTYVGTAALVNKIETVLATPQSIFGRRIYLKNKKCLESKHRMANCNNCHEYYTNVQPCDNTAFQQWRLQSTNKGKRLQVKAVELPLDSTTRCLDCWHGKNYCDVHTQACSDTNDNQYFFIQIRSDQLNYKLFYEYRLGFSRFDYYHVYFSISNIQHPNRCLTLYNSTRNQESFRLQECYGFNEPVPARERVYSHLKDSQSFYLDIDFTQELERVRIIVDYQERLIGRIENALTNYDQAYGRVIHFKSQNKCLEAKWSTHGSEDRDCRGIPNCARYTPNVQPCDEFSGFQQWRLSGDVIGVASKAHLVVKNRKSPCLNCAYGSKDCDIDIMDCIPDHSHQKFLFRIYYPQIDLVNNRIYFSIINQDHPDRCLTLHYNSRYQGEGFKLQPCYGNDDQSFFLDIDFSQEIGKMEYFSKALRRINERKKNSGY